MQAIRFEETRVRDGVFPHGIGHMLFHDYFGQGHQVLPGPQAYLADHLDDGSQIYPHFHDIDQFQVFVGGKGKMGKHEVCPVTIHYADGYSPYGPIVATSKGLSYFTLRLASASGGWRMPGNRHLMPGKAGRTFSTTFDDYAKAPARRGQVVCSTLREAAPDGLEVIGIRIGPDTDASGDAPAGGQYVIVCSGSLRHEGKVLPLNSLLFLATGEPAPGFSAGPAGAVLLVLQYPRPTERPGSNPAREQNYQAEYAMVPTVGSQSQPRRNPS